MDKNKKVALAVVGVIAILFIYLYILNANRTTVPSVTIKAYVLSNDGTYIQLQKEEMKGLSMVTFPSGSPIISSLIKLGVTFTAGSGSNAAPSLQITNITATNSPGTNLFGPAISGFNKQFTLLAGQSNTQNSTPIDTTQIELGNVDFRLTVSGNYRNYKGTIQTFSIQSDPFIINIQPTPKVKFRTLFSDIHDSQNIDGIAWTTNCGSTLKKAEEYVNDNDDGTNGQTCDNFMTNKNYYKMFDIANGVTSVTFWTTTATSNIALWNMVGTNSYKFAICADNPLPVMIGFSNQTSTTISTSPIAQDLSKEMTCTPVCVPSWQCSEWSTCSGGTQTRTCEDLNNCGVSCTGQPECVTSQTCEPQTCGNNIKEGTELCDGDDTCLNVMGGGYTGTAVCVSCTSWDTSGCTYTAPAYVKFRTSSSTYGTTSAIAFNLPSTTRCTITPLETYGRSSSSCWDTSGTSCPNNYASNFIILNQSVNIPGRPSWAGTNIGCLYNTSSIGEIGMAWKVVTTSGSPCTISGKWGFVRYNSGDLDASLVNDSSTSINPSLEVACP